MQYVARMKPYFQAKYASKMLNICRIEYNKKGKPQIKVCVELGSDLKLYCLFFKFVKTLLFTDKAIKNKFKLI